MTTKLSHTEKINTVKVTSSNVISKFGDILFDYVNSVFLSSVANGGLWLSLYQSSEVFISVIFNFLGGVLSDTGNRKKIIWHCDLISGLVCILLAIFIPHVFFIYAIIIINIILAIIFSYRSPAYKAVFREIVQKEHLNQVNSVLEIAKQVIQITGPTGALIIAHFFSNRFALIFDGISFIISGLLIRKLTILSAPVKKKSSKKTFSQIREGLNYIFHNREILIIITFSSIVNFVIAGYNLILPFSTYAFSDSHLKAYAVLLTAESIGGLLGATASTLIKKTPTTNKLLFLIFLDGLALMPSERIYHLSHSIILVAICISLFNFFLSIFNIQFMTFVQVRTDMNYIGRVFGTIFSVAILFMPIGTFFFKFAFNLQNPNNYFVLGSLLTFISIITIILNTIFKSKN